LFVYAEKQQPVGAVGGKGERNRLLPQPGGKTSGGGGG
jgi:hypothetical protein